MVCKTAMQRRNAGDLGEMANRSKLYDIILLYVAVFEYQFYSIVS